MNINTMDKAIFLDWEKNKEPLPWVCASVAWTHLAREA